MVVLEVLAVVLWITYWLGAIVAFMFVFPARAGFGLSPSVYLSAWMHVPSRRNGLAWAVMNLLKAFVWPIIFVKWLADDRPPSKVLFGFAAAERMGFTGDELPYHLRGFASKWTA